MIKYPSLCLIAFLFSVNSLISQDLPEITPPSPTAFQMTSYGDVPINESTGSISPSIPIYTYTAGQLQLPISLSFQGNGTKVDQAAGWTGINWNLNAGGVITRMVIDEDDFEAPRKFYTYDELNSMIDSGSGSDETDLLELKNSGTDSQVDMFNFNFGNYSGSFFLKPELDEYGGNQSLTPYLTKYDTELKIEIGDPPIIAGIIQPNFREITITTPDGVRYFFGGEDASEQSKNQTLGYGLPTPNPFLQTAYYLHRIEHPFGDIIYLEYDTLLDYNLELSKSEHRSIVLLGNNGTPSMSYGTTYQYVQNGRFLKRIYSNRSDLAIDFNSTTISSNPNCIKKLNSIEIKNDLTDSQLQRVGLTYGNSTVGNVLQRFFLTKVSFSNHLSVHEYEYEMVYNDINALPERFSTDQDHMGYFNNKNNGDIRLPNNDILFPNYSSFSDKNPDFDYAIKGTLNTITYPTGGQTNFYYESAPDGYGIRLKATRDRPFDGGVKTKRYIYKGFNFTTNTFDPAESMSHFFTPRYSYDTTGCDGAETTSLHNIQSTSLTNLFCNDVNKRMYNKVTILYGVSATDTPNIGDKGAVVKEFIVNSDALSLQLLSPFNYDPLPTDRSNKSLRNGTLLKETYVKKVEGQIQKVKETAYEYSSLLDLAASVPNVNAKDLRNGCLYENLDNLYLGFYETLSNRFKLESTSTTYFDYSNITPNGEIGEYTTVTNQFFDNNDYIQPTKIEIIESNGTITGTDLYYPYDVIDSNSLPGSPLSPSEFYSISQLNNHWHNIKTPVQVDKYTVQNGLQKKLSSMRNLYKDHLDLTVPSVVRVSKEDDTLYDVVVFHSTDSNGNPVEVSMADGTRIHYIWGYNKTKPIAKIENFTLGTNNPINSLISIAVEASNADVGTTAQENALRTALKNIQDNVALINAQMSYFTYDPLIGLTSMTDPKGYTMYYEYDEFQRLKFIKDASGHIISEHKSNFKN